LASGGDCFKSFVCVAGSSGEVPVARVGNSTRVEDFSKVVAYDGLSSLRGVEGTIAVESVLAITADIESDGAMESE